MSLSKDPGATVCTRYGGGGARRADAPPGVPLPPAKPSLAGVAVPSPASGRAAGLADEAAATSSFKIDVAEHKCIAIFTEHDPEDFRANGHYLDAERIVDEL